MSNPKGPKKPPTSKSGKLGQKPRGSKPVDKPFAFEEENTPRLNAPRVDRPAQPLNDMRLGELTIDRMSHDGRGIAQWNGKTLFVEGALTGERISARLVRDHARYAEGRVEKLIHAAPERVQPECAHYAECGGCQLQHFDAEKQISFKETSVLQQLDVWGGVKPKQILPPIRSSSNAYRRCARMGVSYSEGQVTLGFRKNHSRLLVDVALCSVLTPELNALIAPLKKWLTELRAAEAVTHVELIQTEDECGLVLRHVQPLDQVDLDSLAHLAGQLSVSIWLKGGESNQLRNFQGQDVDPRLHYSVNALTLGFHPMDFVQVNPSVNIDMVNQAIGLLGLKGSERVLDLFCGIGNFTLPLAKQCAEVIGIEAVESMVERGRENASKLGISNVQFLAANLSRMSEHRLNQVCGKVDAVLLDPPRDGAKEIVEKLSQLSPKRIVYVSCNPATLARDAKILVASGYQLDSVGVLDMFPHTAHVESMALFVKR